MRLYRVLDWISPLTLNANLILLNTLNANVYVFSFGTLNAQMAIPNLMKVGLVECV